MVQQQPNGDAGDVTLKLAPWQVAEIRRQLYIDLRELAEHIATEAGSASETSSNDPHGAVLGADLQAFCHRTFADAVSLLDAIGWDVSGDLDVLYAHGQPIYAQVEESGRYDHPPR